MFSRYLSPKNDLSFRKIFGDEKHKGIPIDFLNALLRLEDEDRIVDLEFLNPNQLPEISSRKVSQVDVMVRDEKGVRYIVEMQVAKNEGFQERAQYYASKTYCAQFGKGGQYSQLKKVVFLAILDYTLFPEKDRFKSNHRILDELSKECDLKGFSFTFIELSKFKKSLEELKTIEDKWYYFLKHADKDQKTAQALSDHDEIKEAYEILNKQNWSEEEMDQYERLIMQDADHNGIIDAAKNEGLQKGLKKGLKKGLEKGREEGRKEGRAKGKEEGREEGEKKKALQIAEAMLDVSMQIDKICKLTSLSESEVNALKKCRN